jgi:8-oxo-dGTP pyrophosphatase MutT (NUDIX family)
VGRERVDEIALAKKITKSLKVRARRKGRLKKKASERHQVAALPFRKNADGAIEVLLITSRETRRFIIPKGWPMKKLADSDAAAKEALEEAGVTGKVRRKPIAHYSYWKRLTRTFELVKVDVYPLKVAAQKKTWREKGSRNTGWLSPAQAWLLIDEPGLAQIVRSFDP